MNPVLSIVTVTRNNEAGLRSTLSSLRNCAGATSEWVVVDGASEDGTDALLHDAEASMSGWVTTLSEPDEGIYDAMNKGIARCRGDWVLFLNAGDRLASPGALSALVQFLERDRESSWVLANGRLVDASGADIVVRRSKDYSRFLARLGMRPLLHQALTYRVTALRALGGFTRADFCADQFVNLQLMTTSDPVLLDVDLVVCEGGGVSMQREHSEFMAHLADYRADLSFNIGGSPITDALCVKTFSGLLEAKRIRSRTVRIRQDAP